MTTPIHFSTVHPHGTLLRQTPNNDGVWEDLRFRFGDDDMSAGWLVVYDEPALSLKTAVPCERRILFIAEPPEMKTYPRACLNQFGIVVSPYPVTGFNGRLIMQQSGLPWHYGLKRGEIPDDAAALQWQALSEDKPKSKLISVICSNKALVPQQRQRLYFVECLKKRLGDRIDVFGRGFNPIDDKAEAIAPYRYHIALENNVIDHFWTEKLADAWLGDSYPIFSGCKNIRDYFDPKGMAQIDIQKPDQAIDQIEKILDSNLWENSRAIIRENRRRLMMEHNLFAVIAKIVASCSQSTRAAAPVAPAAILRSHQRNLRSLLRKVLNRGWHSFYFIKRKLASPASKFGAGRKGKGA